MLDALSVEVDGKQRLKSSSSEVDGESGQLTIKSNEFSVKLKDFKLGVSAISDSQDLRKIQ